MKPMEREKRQNARTFVYRSKARHYSKTYISSDTGAAAFINEEQLVISSNNGRCNRGMWSGVQWG